MVTLKRGQIGRVSSTDMLDVTVKNAKGSVRMFAPSWDMVMGHKNNPKTWTDAHYTFFYLDKLSRIPVEVWEKMHEWGVAHGGSITLMCFCKDGTFCHTYLLIEHAVKHFPRLFRSGL